MSEKRFKVIDDDFSMWIVYTTLKEDKHEGAIYTAYDMCYKLNELYEENEQLKKELLRIQKTVSSIQKEINNYYNEVCSNE